MYYATSEGLLTVTYNTLEAQHHIEQFQHKSEAKKEIKKENLKNAPGGNNCIWLRVPTTEGEVPLSSFRVYFVAYTSTKLIIC